MEGLTIIIATVIAVIALLGLLGKVSCNCKQTDSVEKKIENK